MRGRVGQVDALETHKGGSVANGKVKHFGNHTNKSTSTTFRVNPQPLIDNFLTDVLAADATLACLSLKDQIFDPDFPEQLFIDSFFSCV